MQNHKISFALSFLKKFLSLSTDMDQLTEYKELKAVEKKIDQFNEQHGARILELTLKAGRTPEETEALNLLKGQLADLEKNKAFWSKRLDVAQQQSIAP